MPSFVEIKQSIYTQITPLGDERTDFYRSHNPVIRWIFWDRLRQIAKLMRKVNAKGICLDFGGGSGVFLPTLSAHYTRVKCIDLDAQLAKKITHRLALSNVDVHETDVADPDETKYNAIVAADVLEHFNDLSIPIEAIRRRLAKDGWLFTSLPTETWLYAAIRWVIRKKKPADHFHSAYEVEAFLRTNGFVRVHHTSIPIHMLAPLFLISAWRRDDKS